MIQAACSAEGVIAIYLSRTRERRVDQVRFAPWRQEGEPKSGPAAAIERRAVTWALGSTMSPYASTFSLADAPVLLSSRARARPRAAFDSALTARASNDPQGDHQNKVGLLVSMYRTRAVFQHDFVYLQLNSCTRPSYVQSKQPRHTDGCP